MLLLTSCCRVDRYALYPSPHPQPARKRQANRPIFDDG